MNVIGGTTLVSRSLMKRAIWGGGLESFVKTVQFWSRCTQFGVQLLVVCIYTYFELQRLRKLLTEQTRFIYSFCSCKLIASCIFIWGGGVDPHTIIQN